VGVGDISCGVLVGVGCSGVLVGTRVHVGRGVQVLVGSGASVGPGVGVAVGQGIVCPEATRTGSVQEAPPADARITTPRRISVALLARASRFPGCIGMAAPIYITNRCALINRACAVRAYSPPSSGVNDAENAEGAEKIQEILRT